MFFILLSIFNGPAIQASKQCYPILLVHGIARFDLLTHQTLKILNLFSPANELELDSLHYFRNIASEMKSHGYKVYHSSSRFAASIEERARDLEPVISNILETSKSSKLHLIAHSMGGLDARYLIATNSKLSQNIASLTTIGTPHLGTSFADQLLETGGNSLINFLEPIINLKGYKNLSQSACSDFNQKYESVEAENQVVYHVWSTYQHKNAVSPVLRISFDSVYKLEGKCDGVVSVNSQLWVSQLTSQRGSIKPVYQHNLDFRADHFNQIGWWNICQLNDLRSWFQNPSWQRLTYEKKIKQMYLDIARILSEIR